MRVDGSLGLGPRLVGTDLRIGAAGADLSQVAALIPDLPSLPAERYEVAGRVRVVADGYALDAVEASVGDVELTLDGCLGALPDLDGTDLSVEVRGPRLASLASFLDVPALSAEEPFEVSLTSSGPPSGSRCGSSPRGSGRAI